MRAYLLLLAAALASAAHAEPERPSVPALLPEPGADGVIYLPGADGTPRATTLNPEMQRRLTAFLIDSRSPIAAVVVADAHDGSILAMAQGRDPAQWGGKTHTALHAGFPAASVFKTIVTTAAFEIADVDSAEPVGLTGGCSHVRETGDFLKEQVVTTASRMTLRKAFGSSCNGFFARIGVNTLGLGPIMYFAKRFGWDQGVPTDFKAEKSPFHPPAPQNSSTHTVGAFAAGFGRVGMSPVHAAWIMLTIANHGAPLPLRLFKDTPAPAADDFKERIFSEKTGERLNEILDASVKSGTASFAFKRGKYRKLKELTGGKTGTLTGSSPKGLTTWFAGLAPVAAPEVVVASVVVLDERWHIKAPNLAAEGLLAFFEGRMNEKGAMSTAVFAPVAAGPAKRKK